MNDGYTMILCPICNANGTVLRIWVRNQAENNFVLTAINPNTGATVNNTQLQVRYFKAKIGHHNS